MVTVSYEKESRAAREEREFNKRERAERRRLWELKGRGKKCQMCFDEGYAVDFADEYSASEIMWVCGCGALRRMQAEEYEKDVPQRPIDTFRVKKAHHGPMLDIAKKFINQEEKMWMFVGGAVGSGKTHLCEVVVKQLFDKHQREIQAVKWREISKKLKANPNEEALILELTSVPILYIDDLFKSGGDKITEADVTNAYDILEGRLKPGKWTIMSSEYTHQSIREIDESVASRIVEGAGQYIINISKGEDKDMRYEK